MVGVGLEGAESSLARVSLVNFYGAEILDVFVRQRERVVDYRTQWSGIRDTDMVHGQFAVMCVIVGGLLTSVWTAKPFGEVQKQVADLLEDRILVGHAVHNDLKVWYDSVVISLLLTIYGGYRLSCSRIHGPVNATRSTTRIKVD